MATKVKNYEVCSLMYYTKGLSSKKAIQLLFDQEDEINSNDLSRLELTLANQASTLDAIFHSMAHQAALIASGNTKLTNMYLNLAFKAQNQCKNTIQTLHNIKNPKHITIAKQANIANQQIVNNNPVDTTNHKKNSEKSTNELLDYPQEGLITPPKATTKVYEAV